MPIAIQIADPQGRTDCLRQKSNDDLFNRNNFDIRCWSWNYRGCWHQTCPPIDSRKEILKIDSFQSQDMEAHVLSFLVTTSLGQEW